MVRRLLALLVTGSVLGPVPRVAAQQADTIRGRVVDSAGAAVAYSTVSATSMRLGTLRTAVTDDSGRYTVVFDDPGGPYLLRFIVLGFEAEQMEVRRRRGAAAIVADVRLPYTVRPLSPVVVTFRVPRPRPSRDGIDTRLARADDTTNADDLTFEQAGNLAALAGRLPGMQLLPGRDGNPDGFSALGLSPDQNRTTINGMATPVTTIPRDAAVNVTVATTPYDVSRGGFSGAEVRVVTRPGSNFSSRAMSANIIAPQLQWTDRAAKGQQYTNISLGGAAAGPMVFDKSYYNVSYQVGRRLNDLQSLVNAAAPEMQAAGVARDSVLRLMDILGANGIPASVSAVPDRRTIDQASVLGAFDFAPPSPATGHAFNVTAGGNWTRSAPVATSLLSALPAHDGLRSTWGGSLQGRHTNYFSAGVLTETTLGVSGTVNINEPYVALPHGGVRINSSFGDGTSAVRTVAFGGSPSLTSRDGSLTLALINRLTWLDRKSAHRFALTSEFRYEQFGQNTRTNHLGSFAYNSLADLEAGRPASYARQLTPRRVSGRQMVAGVSLGDSWIPRANLNVQYGVRLDANRFLKGPAPNSAIRVVYDHDNAHVPNKVYASPRAGFAWTYGTAAPYRTAAGPQRGPRPSLRGGAGLFQSTPPMNLLASAEDNTGLPSAVQQLRCVGIATPRPEWESYRADQSTVPGECADGTGATVFASGTPNVFLFDPEYGTRRSVRANLQWSGAALSSRIVATIDATHSLNLDQPGNIDLNFNATERFALQAEAGRPVYVPETSIVTSSGAVATRETRYSQDFARVWAQRSDLQSATNQLSFSVRPLSIARPNFGWSASYVYQDVRDEIRGFSSTTSSPFARDRSRSSSARHQITYQLSYNLLGALRFSWSGRFQSGTRFTPMVAGDVNGDGSGGNDRAFIFDPDNLSDSAASAGMRALLQSGSRAARECLARQLNTLARRNTCETPWLTSASLSIAVNSVKIGLPPRTTLSLQVTNPLGAADLLLHGEKGLRGWGQSERPDQTLLYVRGFDRDARQFRYEVNERFGATRPRETAIRAPVMITALLRLDIGTPRQRQTLTQQLDRGRRLPGTPAAENALRSLGRAAIPNPMARILQQRDSLRLSALQIDSLTSLDRAFTARVDSIWNPVGRFLATLPASYDDNAAYTRYRRAREASMDLLIGLLPELREILSQEQLRRLPPGITTLLDRRYLRSIRSNG
jgi:hypothetical protein